MYYSELVQLVLKSQGARGGHIWVNAGDIWEHKLVTLVGHAGDTRETNRCGTGLVQVLNWCRIGVSLVQIVLKSQGGTWVPLGGHTADTWEHKRLTLG